MKFILLTVRTVPPELENPSCRCEGKKCSGFRFELGFRFGFRSFLNNKLFIVSFNIGNTIYLVSLLMQNN